MKDWKSLFEEKVSSQHRDKVLDAARGLLKERVKERRSFFSVGLRWGLAAAAAALAIWIRPRDEGPVEELAALTEDIVLDPDMSPEDISMLQDLEIIEQLEKLENQNG